MNDHDDDPIKKIAEMMMARQQWSDQMDKITSDGSDAIESAVLMDLWKDLGDHTATYWEAMSVVSNFHRALKSVRKLLPPESRASVHALRALASCIFCDAKVASILLDEREKHHAP